MKIRRYLGHDCDSVNGFNDGYYMDSSEIECRDLEHAEQLCCEALEQYSGQPRGNFDFDNNTDAPVVTLITGYYNSETGDDLTVSQYEASEEDDAHYRYVYVSAEIISE